MLVISLLLAGILVVAGIYILRSNDQHARDAIEREQSEQREQTRNHVLEQLASGAPLETILESILLGVEQQHPEILGSIQLLDSEGVHLHTATAPSLPDTFIDALNGIEIGVGAGSCGTAAFTGQRVVVPDIQNHPYWVEYGGIAAQVGLGACWSEPIRAFSGKILGTLAIYHRQRHQPADDEIQQVEQAAHLAAIAIGRNHSEQALKQSEKLLSEILENVSAEIYMKNVVGKYLFANRLLRERFDAPLEEVVGYDDSKFFDAGTAATIREDDLRVLRDGEKVEAEEIVTDILRGVTRVYMTVKIPLRHEDGRVYALCGISTDITERKDIEEHMQHMAQYDALTHLPNRALFDDRLRQALASAQRNQKNMALMFIDLDKFKPVNDTFGHAVGDLLLKDVALRIQDCLRESDTAARIGGDEFVILLPSIEATQDAGVVGEKILYALNQPFELAGHTLKISSSIGIAVYPDHGGDTKQLVKSADIAMYHAKQNGRDNVKIFESGMHAISE